MDRCNTCRKDYSFALNWGECPSCLEMYKKGYVPAHNNGRKVWRKKEKEEARLAALKVQRAG